jgi:hypothetical protein
MVTKSPEELAVLSPEEMKVYLADEEMTVFGRTRLNEPAFERIKGVPQENGIGSPGHETHNHMQSILKYEGQEAYQAAADIIWKRDPAHAERLGLKRRGVR